MGRSRGAWQSPAPRRCAAAALLVAAALLAAAAAESGALRCPDGLSCQHKIGMSGEHFYTVEGHQIIIKHSTGTIRIKCDGSGVLDSTALPRAGSELRVTRVTLEACPLPTNRSLARVLDALNVSLTYCNRNSLAEKEPSGRLSLEDLLPAPQLTDQHFLGLENLCILQVFAKKNNESVSPKAGFLKRLQNLRELTLKGITLVEGELDKPRPLLSQLVLINTGVTQLPTALLLSTSLSHLKVESRTALGAVAVPPRLLTLNLRSPATKLHVTPALRSFSLTNWSEAHPVPLKSCNNLTKLQLCRPAVQNLPDNWLTNCSQLKTLQIQYANLTSLPPKLLTNASALRNLSLKQCALRTLPEQLLSHAPGLRLLDLTNNYLQMLPSDMFVVARYVTDLNLSSNQLGGDAVRALAPLTRLRKLSLNRNSLGDLCDSNGISPIYKSTNLTELNLEKTNVSRICDDWRENMTLLKLDLRKTSVSSVDLEFKRKKKKLKIMLQGAPVTVVGMTREQFKIVTGEPTSNLLYIHINSKLNCDCNMYWTKRALKIHTINYVSEMHCAEGRALKDMPLEDMLCPDIKAVQECVGDELPGVCAYSWRPDDDPDHDRKLVRVDCRNQGLDYVPIPHARDNSTECLYELLLSHNRITKLPAEVLRRDIKRLDLSYNYLETVTEDTITRIGSFGGYLQFAGNQFDCSCSAAPFLRALTNASLDHATCKDGSALQTAPSVDCQPFIWIACGIAVLLLLVIITVVILASSKRRFFIKAVLHRCGCVWYAVETEMDNNRRYDAFVTFSHKDEQVVLELVARLEPRYRLCLHYRDWIPGRYITEQIAESVQDSRRTIALVSRHFLRSGWALEEFQQAHAAEMIEAKPRLVVVLLEDPSALELDEQFRRYLATKTYVRWDDPWFWDKLALALPRPRTHGVVTTAASVRDVRRPSTSGCTQVVLPTSADIASTTVSATSNAPTTFITTATKSSLQELSTLPSLTWL